MNKHTEGPWVRRHGLNLIGKNRRLVANCDGHAQNFDVEENDAENEANAYLIAAAPDMLAACKCAEEWVGTIEDSDFAVSGGMLLFLLRKVIAAAEGK